MSKNNAIFLGSFDPIHNGHMNIIKETINLGFKVLVIPAFSNSWKPNQTDYYDRVRMCQFAVKDVEGAEVSQIERLIAKKYSLTSIPTFLLLREVSKDMDFTIVTTLETYTQIREWENFEEIYNNYKFLIIPFKDNIHSTRIRESIKDLEFLEMALPWNVRNYILETKLYE